ncbi:Uncharacterized protein PBTT_03067 [Plasmodiophora brassicae]|uniref:Uncharacterized protein n=1 Tax=Plasmodiophora brassicae TaxID=37360 RepID=A0A0G4J6N5_PLABS|nr:hypothetical protein PBRA_003013 [Plasmodiophora brassicae]
MGMLHFWRFMSRVVVDDATRFTTEAELRELVASGKGPELISSFLVDHFHEFFAGADIESLTGRPQSALNKFIKEELCKRQDMADVVNLPFLPRSRFQTLARFLFMEDTVDSIKLFCIVVLARDLCGRMSDMASIAASNLLLDRWLVVRFARQKVGISQALPLVWDREWELCPEIALVIQMFLFGAQDDYVFPDLRDGRTNRVKDGPSSAITRLMKKFVGREFDGVPVLHAEEAHASIIRRSAANDMVHACVPADAADARGGWAARFSASVRSLKYVVKDATMTLYQAGAGLSGHKVPSCLPQEDIILPVSLDFVDSLDHADRQTVLMVARSTFADTGLSDGPVLRHLFAVLLRFVSILVDHVSDHLVLDKVRELSITTGVATDTILRWGKLVLTSFDKFVLSHFLLLKSSVFPLVNILAHRVVFLAV